MYSHLHIKENERFSPFAFTPCHSLAPCHSKRSQEPPPSHSHHVIPKRSEESPPFAQRKGVRGMPTRHSRAGENPEGTGRENHGNHGSNTLSHSEAQRGTSPFAPRKGARGMPTRHSRAGENPERKGGENHGNLSPIMAIMVQNLPSSHSHHVIPKRSEESLTSFSRRRESRAEGTGKIMAIIPPSWQSWFTPPPSSPRRRESRAEGTGKITAIMAPHNRRNTNCQTAIVATTADTPATMKANGAPHTCANVPINSAPSACAPQVKFIRLITRPRN